MLIIYCEELQRLRCNWMLHRDNALSLTVFIVSELLAKMGLVTLPRPSNSRDLSPIPLFVSKD